METLYRVVFSGELVPGLSAQQIIEAFSARFQVREETARGIILRGDRIVFKHDLNHTRAQRYSLALKQAGLLVTLEAQDQDPTAGLGLEQPPSIDLRQSESLFPQSELTAEPPKAVTPGGQRCPKCGANAVAPLTGVCQACGVVVERYLARHGQSPAPAAAADNPYAPPQADLTRPSTAIDSDTLHPARAVAAGRGWAWVTEAWDLFKGSPWAWIGASLLYILIAVVLSFVPFVGSLISTILGPVFTGGLMIGAHTQQTGGRFEVQHLFAGFSRNPGPLALVGAAYIGFGLLIALIIGLGMAAVFALAGPGFAAGFDPNHLDSEQLGPLMPLLLVPMLFGLLFVIPLAMAVLFAPALVALNDVPVMQSFKLSFQGCWRNILPFLIYGLVGLVLTLVSMVTLGLGLLVVIPVLTIAIYCAYRDIYYR